MNRFSWLSRTALASLLVVGSAACGAGSRAGTVASASLAATCTPAGASSLVGFPTGTKRAVFTWATTGNPVTFQFSQVGSATRLETATPKDALSLSASVFDKAGRNQGTATADCADPTVAPPLPPATDVLITVEDQSSLNSSSVPPSSEPATTAVPASTGPVCSPPTNVSLPTVIADPNSRTFLIVGSEGAWESADGCGAVARTLQWERNPGSGWQGIGAGTYVNTYCGGAEYPKYRLRVTASNNAGTSEVLSATVVGRC